MTHLIKKIIKGNKSVGSKAFTLFVSLLVAALLLAVGFSIGNILIKQLTLASSGSGSQIAFYAADSAAECALFWDRKNKGGFSVVDSPFGVSTSDQSRLICGGGRDGVDDSGLVFGFTKVCDDGLCSAATTRATSTFYVDTQNIRDTKSKSCAFVTVVKVFDPDTGVEETTIDAKGYNTELYLGNAAGAYTFAYQNPDASCNLSRPKTVERALHISY